MRGAVEWRRGIAQGLKAIVISCRDSDASLPTHRCVRLIL